MTRNSQLLVQWKTVFVVCLLVSSSLWAQANSDSKNAVKTSSPNANSIQQADNSGPKPHDDSFVIGNDDKAGAYRGNDLFP